jgi:hypothetical protein
MLFWAVLTLAFLRFWGAIDGTNKWARKQRESQDGR